MSVRCYEFRDWRTHVIGVTALLRLGVIRRCGVRLGLQPRSLFRISLFALLTPICLFIKNLYLQFRFN